MGAISSRFAFQEKGSRRGSVQSGVSSTLVEQPSRRERYFFGIGSNRRKVIQQESHSKSSETVDESMFKWIKDRKFHNLESIYLLPADMKEQHRMMMSHHTVNFVFGRNYYPPLRRVLQTASILDVGCGSGFWVTDMAREFPSSTVLGIDMVDVFYVETNGTIPSNCRYELGNVLTGLDYENESFDFIHVRFLILGWTSAEWDIVLKELLRLLRPGGWIQLVEADYDLFRPGPVSSSLVEKNFSLLRGKGIEPTSVRTLDQKILSSGFTDVRVVRKSVPNGEWGGEIGTLLKKDTFFLLEAARTSIGPLVPDAQYDAMLYRMRDEFETYRSYTMFYLYAARKPGGDPLSPYESDDEF